MSSCCSLTLEKQWIEWVGKILSREVRDSNLHVIVTKQCNNAHLMDGNSKLLCKFINDFFIALQIVLPLGCATKPIKILGGKGITELHIRQISRLDSPVQMPISYRLRNSLDADELGKVITVTNNLDKIKSYDKLHRDDIKYKKKLFTNHYL